MASHQILSLLEEGEPRRAAQRRRVMLTAKLSTSSAEFEILIRDVSTGGARIQGAELPAQGTMVMLKRGSFNAFGDLVWVNGTQGGIAFDEPLDEAALMDSIRGLPEEQAGAQVPYRRPGFERGTHGRLSDGRGWLDAAARR